MNKFVIFGFIVLYLQAPTSHAFTEADLDETDLHCLKELKYDKKEIIDCFDENDFIKEGDDKMNSFYECGWKKDKLQNDDGSINVDNLQKVITVKLEKLFPGDTKYKEFLANAVVKACKDVKGSSNGDTDVKIYNCSLRKVGEISAKTKPGDV